MCRTLLALSVALLLTSAAPVLARLYPIGPGDIVEVQVAEMPSLNVEQEVSEEGTLTLPIVGEVEVEGVFENELVQHVRELLEEKGLRQATVRVRVTLYRSHTVTIVGMVEKPGVFPVTPTITLRDVLDDAEGLSAGHGPTLRIRRREANGLSNEIEIDLRELAVFGEPRLDIPVFAGDTIHVPPAETMTVCLVGVASNGCRAFPIEPPPTLFRTILSSGGLPATASKKVIVRRLKADGTRDEIVVNYKHILEGKMPDFVLVDGDLVHVKESFF